MNRREKHVPGEPASAGVSGASTVGPKFVFAEALQARLHTAGARVRQECSHLDQVEAVASEYLSAALPPGVCD